jgi:hypothetical protein
MQTFVSESSGSLESSYDAGGSYPVLDDKVYSIVDTTPPTIVGRDTADLNGDGWIDALNVSFSKAIDDATVVATDFVVAGAGALGFAATTNGDTANDTDIYLTFTDGVLATDAVPALTYTMGSLMDLTGLSLASSGPIAATDVAGPAIWSAVASDAVVVGAGIDGDDTVTITFSEATNQPVLNGANIDAVASLSSGHVWVDGSGAIGAAAWGPADTLVVTLAVAVAQPTVAVADTITLDGTTITDGTTGGATAPSVPITGLFWSGLAARAAEDSDNNGHVDRVMITTIGPLNDDFSTLTMAVGGYGTFGSAGDFATGVPGDAVFYVLVPEAAALDTDATPAVQVLANSTLQVSGETLTAEPTATAATDAAPPIIGYTLGAVGSSEVAVYFSEPMAMTMTAGDFSFSGAGAPTSLTPVTVSGGGWHEVLLGLSAALTAPDVVLPETIAANAAVTDLVAQPIPVALRSHLVSDLLVGVAAPLWASDGIQGDGSTGTGALRELDGTGALTDRDITLQVAVEPAAAALSPIELWYDVDASAAPWLPVVLPDLVSVANAARAATPLASVNLLHDFLIPATDAEIEVGAEVEFVLKLGTRYAVRLQDATDVRSVAPWSFAVREVVSQRGGVTILQNVIDPSIGERSTLTFALDRAGLVTILVTNLAGDVVDILLRGPQPVGRQDINWDGRNRAGQIVGRGIYFITVAGPGIQESRKVLVIKP